MSKKVEINLLGTSFSISSDQETEYLLTLIQEYEKCVLKAKTEVNSTDPLKSAIIAGIIAIDEKTIPTTSTSMKPKEIIQSKEIDPIIDNILKKITNCLNNIN